MLHCGRSIGVRLFVSSVVRGCDEVARPLAQGRLAVPELPAVPDVPDEPLVVCDAPSSTAPLPMLAFTHEP